MKNAPNKLSYAVIFTSAKEGGYTATVPALPGCISEGDTFEKAKKNITEAMELYLEVVMPKGNLSRFTDFVVAPISVNV